MNNSSDTEKEQLESIELKPCPFCGSSDLYFGAAAACTFHVQCMKCLCQGTKHAYPTYSEKDCDWDIKCKLNACKSWNTRVTDVNKIK